MSNDKEGENLRYVRYDPKYHFKYYFDTRTGGYVRSGVLIGPLTVQKQNRFCKVQFLTLAPNTGWDHYTNMLFLCYLIKAAVSVCLLGLELGKSQSET